MKATGRIVCKLALIALLGSVFALQAVALVHEHEELADALSCPCVHADKVEWNMAAQLAVSQVAPSLGTHLEADFSVAFDRNFLPVRARSPPSL